MSARVSPQVGLNAPPQWHGIYLARTVNNRAADQWLQLQIPQVLGAVLSNWAAPVGTDGAGPGPAPGTVVLAMFVGGDINTPVYLPSSQQLR